MLRRCLILLSLFLPFAAPAAAQELRIGPPGSRIDFQVGESVFFRTTGTFNRWQGKVLIDQANIAASKVEVEIETSSVDTRDADQDVQLRGPDFFDVAKFPTMSFVSARVERTGPRSLRIEGQVSLRGIVQPMNLDVEVAHDALQAGTVAAQFTATGRIKRSQFGMTKYLDVTGDTVDIRIKADAVR